MTNTRAAMIIEIVSTDPNAPAVTKQKAENRADGTNPERTFEFPEWSGDMHNIVYDKDDDLIVVASPRVLGTTTKARPILFHMARAGALLKLPDTPPMPTRTEADQGAILALIRPWSGKSSVRGRGRPPKKSQPSDDVRKLGKVMWQSPDKYERHEVIAYHEEELGRVVKYWELKHWYGDKRAKDEEPDDAGE